METEHKQSHKRGGKKAVTKFELTLARSSLCKTHVYLAMEEFCESLCVSQEQHSEEGDVFVQRSQHFHCYLQLYQPSRIVDLRGVVGLNLFGDEEQTWESIHLSTLRNSKHWIKYITKEDPFPMFKNMDSGMFHQSYKIHKYIRENEEFDNMHPFCRQNPSLINILRKTHADYWTKKTLSQHAKAVIQRPTRPAYHVDWVLRTTAALALRKHVYLWGDTGTGKTCLLTHYALTARAVWLPCETNGWEFGALDNYSTLVIAGDAPENYLSVHRSTILRLCDRDPVSVNVKCGAYKSVIFNGSLVIASNYPPPNDPALLRRFEVIYTDCDGFYKEKDEAISVPSSPGDTQIWITSDEESEGESL